MSPLTVLWGARRTLQWPRTAKWRVVLPGLQVHFADLEVSSGNPVVSFVIPGCCANKTTLFACIVPLFGTLEGHLISMPPRRRLQQYAVAVSILSLFYNTAEGVVSIAFGAESSSRALIFYGLQSAVEVISDFLVAWRFLSAFKSDDTTDGLTSPKSIRIERIATITIGGLLIALTIAGVTTSGISLAAHDHPSTTLPAILIAAISTGFTLLLYLAKRYLAHALDSSVLNGEALCALCCMQLSIVLLVGSLVYRVWKGGWWVDAATAIVIAVMFGWEGVKMVKWARNDKFDGGLCGSCHSKDTSPSAEAEKPKEPDQNCSPSSRCCGSPTKEEPLRGEPV